MSDIEVRRLVQPPEQSFFLFGPRGTGKSTWMRSTFPEAVRFNLLSERLYHDYLTRPEAFGDALRALAPGTTVCVDEIQRLPQLLNEAHRFIEERRLRFVLCGSSARKLKAQSTNLLGGRALRRDLHPFVPAELGAAFDLDSALVHGTLPVIRASPHPEEALVVYAETYLREEIRAEALVRNLPAFARFLRVAGLFHGQVMNAASLARDAGVARMTVVGYVDILVDTLVAFRLPAFEAKLRVREKRNPKFYWFDAGVARAVRGDRGAPTSAELGALFEGWVANLLRIHDDYEDLYDEIGYWAPSEAIKTEVDFVLRRGSEHLAIEAKAGDRVGPDELRGLEAIEGLPNLVRRILVYRGERPLVTKSGIEVLPVERFHEELATKRLWPGAG
ncbi:MAG: ATP-binding protein [Planctomycetes bacterium]|nr:ATP-binding protein [Planctomycetota bacterium]